MSNLKRYPIAKSIDQMTGLLGIDAARVTKRAGLAADFLEISDGSVTAKEYFALWDAVFDEIGDPEFALKVGQEFAGSPFIPAMLAFSSSPNAAAGLGRLALFKPLVGPIKLELSDHNEQFHIVIKSADQRAPMPGSAAAFELVYFVESTRKFTGHTIKPKHIGMPASVPSRSAFDRYFGVKTSVSDAAEIVLSAEDASRPFFSQNEDFWHWLEIDLKRQLSEREKTTPLSERVRVLLIELLPSGEVSTDLICQKLGMSKRSLQRKLSEENSNFQTVLDATRSELATRYLSKGEMSVEEISYLLAYQDPNSFYRAFHGWTGMTPAEARGQTLQ